MKNIFYFNHINKIGGIETFFYQLAQLLNGEVCYLYGDVYYTEETMKTIVETETKDYDNWITSMKDR